GCPDPAPSPATGHSTAGTSYSTAARRPGTPAVRGPRPPPPPTPAPARRTGGSPPHGGAGRPCPPGRRRPSCTRCTASPAPSPSGPTPSARPPPRAPSYRSPTANAANRSRGTDADQTISSSWYTGTTRDGGATSVDAAKASFEVPAKPVAPILSTVPVVTGG